MVCRPFMGQWVIGFFGLCLVVALMACAHTVSKNLPVVERGVAERLGNE